MTKFRMQLMGDGRPGAPGRHVLRPAREDHRVAPGIAQTQHQAMGEKNVLERKCGPRPATIILVQVKDFCY